MKSIEDNVRPKNNISVRCAWYICQPTFYVPEYTFFLACDAVLGVTQPDPKLSKTACIIKKWVRLKGKIGHDTKYNNILVEA